MNRASRQPSRSDFFGPNRVVKRKKPGRRHGWRQFRPVVAGLEDRRLLASYVLTTLASFDGTDGYGPANGIGSVAGVVLDSQGNLYGTTGARSAVLPRVSFRGRQRVENHHDDRGIQRHLHCVRCGSGRPGKPVRYDRKRVRRRGHRVRGRQRLEKHHHHRRIVTILPGVRPGSGRPGQHVRHGRRSHFNWYV